MKKTELLLRGLLPLSLSICLLSGMSPAAAAPDGVRQTQAAETQPAQEPSAENLDSRTPAPEDIPAGSPPVQESGQAEQGSGGGILGEYDEPISREGFCSLVISLMAQQEGSSIDELYNRLTDHQKNESFQDITQEDKYISLAKKYELVNGTGELTFSPKSSISRQEIASILMNLVKRLAPARVDGEADYSSTVSVEDHVEVAEWARQGVAFCVREELLQLDSNGNFDPTATMTTENAILLMTDIKEYLNTPVAEEEQKGVPGYVWGILIAVLAAALAGVLAVVLRRNGKQKEDDHRRQERRREDELDKRPTGGQSGSAPTPAPAPTPASAPQDGSGWPTGEETVVVREDDAFNPFNPGGTVALFGSGAAPVVHVTGVQGVNLDQSFSLQVPLSIGRDPDNTLRLEDGTVSRHHCRLRWRAGEMVLEDAGARNPICVLRGREKLDVPVKGCVPLMTGDQVQVGTLLLKFTFGF